MTTKVELSLTGEQAQALFDCLNAARKTKDIKIARNAFGLIDLLIAATNAAKAPQNVEARNGSNGIAPTSAESRPIPREIG
jgi:hypothetical protein